VIQHRCLETKPGGLSFGAVCVVSLALGHRFAKHEILRYPSSRIGTIDLGQIGLRKHHLAGLLEVDVTEASAEMAIKLSSTFGTSPEFWLNAQQAVDIYRAKQRIRKIPEPLIQIG
jgi:hypothetical protein